WPALSRMIPEPSPVLSSICTTEGEIVETTFTNALCSARPWRPAGPTGGCDWVESVARETATTPPPATTIAATTGANRRTYRGIPSPEPNIRASSESLTDPVMVTAGSASAHPRVTQTLAPNYLSAQRTRRLRAVDARCVCRPD